SVSPPQGEGCGSAAVRPPVQTGGSSNKLSMPNRTLIRSLKSYVPARSNTSYELSAPSNGDAGVVGGSRPASMLELMAACEASIALGKCRHRSEVFQSPRPKLNVVNVR